MEFMDSGDTLSATTPVEANNEDNFKKRAKVVLNFEANLRYKRLNEIFTDEDEFVTNAMRGGKIVS